MERPECLYRGTSHKTRDDPQLKLLVSARLIRPATSVDLLRSVCVPGPLVRSELRHRTLRLARSRCRNGGDHLCDSDAAGDRGVAVRHYRFLSLELGSGIA